MAVLCVVGAVSLIKWCVLKLLTSGKPKRAYVVFLKGENSDIELQTAIDTVRWDSALYNCLAYAVDMELDYLDSQRCQKMCKTSGFKFLTADEFSKIMDDI